MKTMIINWAIRIVVGKVIPAFVDGVVSTSTINRIADKYAKIVTDVGKKAVGSLAWNSCEDMIQQRLNQFWTRFNDKLDYDD